MASTITKDIDICFSDDDIIRRPSCPHGPTILFERYGKNNIERFYGCSCCRDRKGCSFYQRHGEQVSTQVLAAREKHNKRLQPPFTHGQYRRRFKDFTALNVSERAACLDCGLLLLKGEETKHAAHAQKSHVTDAMLTTPTRLLYPLSDNKTNAQYLFSDKSMRFLTDTFKRLGYSKLLCIGAPRVHEAIQVDGRISSLLLDIDHRYEQFYEPTRFQRYNMFNNHLFSGEKAHQALRRFLLEDTGPIAVFTDPPFGGLVSLIAHTLNSITNLWREVNSRDADYLPIFWVFPYFMEPRILDAMSQLQMLDYKIEYDNHRTFTDKQKKGSPVRIFTNVPPKEIVLPEDDGYRFCASCDHHVALENRHCDVCGSCTSKDGSTYRHCDKCGRCVKPSRVHCDTCNTCLLPNHTCGQTSKQGCHICGDSSHKRRDCPKRHALNINSKLPGSGNEKVQLDTTLVTHEKRKQTETATCVVPYKKKKKQNPNLEADQGGIRALDTSKYDAKVSIETLRQKERTLCSSEQTVDMLFKFKTSRTHSKKMSKGKLKKIKRMKKHSGPTNI